MILRQFLHTDPVVSVSCLLGCAGHGTAAVVDPVASPEEYLAAANRLGLRIQFVIDTHVHADHLSTGPALAAASAASYVLHAGSGALLSLRGVGDGEELELGNVRLTVLHVPGHTPEHIALLGRDHTRGPEPWFVLTGHTLMVGDMGRTELASGAQEGARALFRSARRLRERPGPACNWSPDR